LKVAGATEDTITVVVALTDIRTLSWPGSRSNCPGSTSGPVVAGGIRGSELVRLPGFARFMLAIRGCGDHGITGADAAE
jgi:hypothetical protein